MDVQSDLLEDLATRIVVPLRRSTYIGPKVTPLNPVFKIEGAPCVMDTPQIVGYPRQALKRPIANLAASGFEIQNALDFLFAGV